ncbi:hypothetical protein AAFF_G00418280 [Aldrovandia affinis]|uniref:Uncharacterized protein n=1 Tax=Aldrovandia affinis TaxID=143900 RepID=A0AAD7SAF6_9TELE|nr:hypothetical protein AAFF_G00418280 [Aldrovandia affinis]
MAMCSSYRVPCGQIGTILINRGRDRRADASAESHADGPQGDASLRFVVGGEATATRYTGIGSRPTRVVRGGSIQREHWGTSLSGGGHARRGLWRRDGRMAMGGLVAL